MSKTKKSRVTAVVRLLLKVATTKKQAEKVCKGICIFYSNAKLSGESKKYEIEFKTDAKDMKPVWIFLLFKDIRDIQIA